MERLGIELVMGDASALPFHASTFERVLSTFGVIYAPDPALAAQEISRVCRSGGAIGLTSWVPDGFFGTVLHRLLEPEARTGSPDRPIPGRARRESAVCSRTRSVWRPSVARW